MKNDTKNTKAKKSDEKELEKDSVTAADDADNTEDKTKEMTEDSKEDQKQEKEEQKEEQKEESQSESEKVAELNDRLMRQMAEFENFRKRSDKEKEQMFEVGAKSVIEKILPIVDNFERGLGTVTDEDKNSKFAEGMQMIYKQLMDELEKLDVKPIEAVGKEFDPNLHNAVMQTESDEYESGTVAQELLKGYTYRDQVVRHSMVSVVQ